MGLHAYASYGEELALWFEDRYLSDIRYLRLTLGYLRLTPSYLRLTLSDLRLKLSDLRLKPRSRLPRPTSEDDPQIKTLKWVAYGYKDMGYFALKILQKCGYLNSKYALAAIYDLHP